MPFALSMQSNMKLSGVHIQLVRCVRRAAELIEHGNTFVVFEGVRPLEQQKAMVKLGHSKTLNSRHLTGHAVDLVPVADVDGDGDVEITWLQQFFRPTVDAMKKAKEELKLDVDWGFELWGWDMPHWQLNWNTFPKEQHERIIN